jgi:hypothetical protein
MELKLTDLSGGQGHDLMFAPSLNGRTGYGKWGVDGNGAGSLTLLVRENLECGGVFVFSFDVSNPNDGQPPPPVRIEAHPLGGSSGTSPTIAQADMTPDQVRIPTDADGVFLPGTAKLDAVAMKIIDPVWTMKTAHQSTSAPCDLNHITVELKSTVQLLAACDVMVTLKGFVGSDTAADPVFPVMSIIFNSIG